MAASASGASGARGAGSRGVHPLREGAPRPPRPTSTNSTTGTTTAGTTSTGSTVGITSGTISTTSTSSAASGTTTSTASYLFYFHVVSVAYLLDHGIGYVALAYFRVFDSGSNVSVDLRPETTRKAMGGSPGVREDPLGSRRSETTEPNSEKVDSSSRVNLVPESRAII